VRQGDIVGRRRTEAPPTIASSRAPALAVDSAAPGSYDSTMPMWRCPHCATPQAEAARCWVCHRSSTACATCRHFRRSVAAQLGYCGLDRRHLPLRGDEIRECWEGAIGVPAPAAGGPPTAGPDRTPVRRREFVPVEPAAPAARARKRPAVQDTARATEGPVAPPVAGEGRWSLWGDAEA
jgi:hypothetical protein